MRYLRASSRRGRGSVLRRARSLRHRRSGRGQSKTVCSLSSNTQRRASDGASFSSVRLRARREPGIGRRLRPQLHAAVAISKGGGGPGCLLRALRRHALRHNPGSVTSAPTGHTRMVRQGRSWLAESASPICRISRSLISFRNRRRVCPNGSTHARVGCGGRAVAGRRRSGSHSQPATAVTIQTISRRFPTPPAIPSSQPTYRENR